MSQNGDSVRAFNTRTSKSLKTAQIILNHPKRLSHKSFILKTNL